MIFRGLTVILSAFQIAGIPFFAYAQESSKELETFTVEEIVISATRTETPYREIANSVTVIGADDIENSQQPLLLDLLRSVPTLDVVQVGGPGGQTSVFMRGANSNHTLVLIDGVEALDPISPSRAFDFAGLTPDNIERIEVLRGPQGTLYGSDAIAGVISIFTKRGNGKPRFTLSSEAGSFETYQNRLGIQGGVQHFNYSLLYSRFDNIGISAAKEADGNSEKDGYKSNAVSAKIGITPRENSSIDLFVRYLDSKSSVDNFGGLGGDDPNNTLDREEFFIRGQARSLLLQSLWEQTIGVSYTEFKRGNNNDVDDDHPESMFQSSSRGTVLKFDWQNNLYTHENNTLTFGIETEEEKGSSERTGDFPSMFTEKTARTTGLYIQDQFNAADRFYSAVGMRFDDHEKFGSHATFRFAPALFLTKNLKLKSVIGTGFKAPSLFQLFSSFGNENLDPEESTGWDIGIEQYGMNDRLTAGITYFSNDFKNLIDFDNTSFKYNNFKEAETKGVESYLIFSLPSGLRLNLSYTFTDKEDKSTGEPLIRRAKNKFNLSVSYRFSERATLQASLIEVGKRDDFFFDSNDFSTTRLELDRYMLVNLAGSYNVTNEAQVFGRVDNLFDEEYVVATGFGSYGIGAYGGIRLTF